MIVEELSMCFVSVEDDELELIAKLGQPEMLVPV